MFHVGDQPVDVQAQDGIVDHPVDQKPEPFFALAEGLLGVAAFGDVAGDLGEPGEPVVVVEQGGDDHVGPELRSVLADPPALSLDAPVGDRGGQLGRRDAGRNVTGRVENREVPTDDLLRPVPLDPLRPGVPRRDHAVDVQSKDRVVDDLVDQIPELVDLGTRRDVV